MGKFIKSRIHRIAISSSTFFDVILSGESGPQIKLVFPEQPSLPKTSRQAFNKDLRSVAGDFNRSIQKLK